MTAFTPNRPQPGERLVKLATRPLRRADALHVCHPGSGRLSTRVARSGRERHQTADRARARLRGVRTAGSRGAVHRSVCPDGQSGHDVRDRQARRQPAARARARALCRHPAALRLVCRGGDWTRYRAGDCAAARGTTVTRAARGGAADPLLSLLAVTLFAAIWSMFGWFVLAAVGGGVIMAIALRRWNTRHPSELAPSSRTPGAEINLSSIPVAGDIGGLLFVIGAIITVLLGLPDIRWFVLGSVVVGAVLAGGLFVWRSSHTSTLTPANSILRR